MSRATLRVGGDRFRSRVGLRSDVIVESLSQEQGHRLALARSTANDAIRAVTLQRDRIKDRDDDAYFAAAGFRQEVDVAFLLDAQRPSLDSVISTDSTSGSGT